MTFKPALSLASLFMVRDAVGGVSVSPACRSLVAKDLAAGRLVLWGDVEGPEIALWALYPSRRLLSARVDLPGVPQRVVPDKRTRRVGRVHRLRRCSRLEGRASIGCMYPAAPVEPASATHGVLMAHTAK